MKHLKRHISEVHKDYKPFECKLCPAKFYQGGHLRSKFCLISFFIRVSKNPVGCNPNGPSYLLKLNMRGRKLIRSFEILLWFSQELNKFRC